MIQSITRKILLICVLFSLHGLSQATPVISMTIENVGHGGQDAYEPPSLAFNDGGPNDAGIAQLHGYSGVFAFGGILQNNDHVGSGNYYLSINLGPEPTSLPPVQNPDIQGAVFSTDIHPIDTSQANLIDPLTNTSFSSGFWFFFGSVFVPKTVGPVVADIDISSGEPVLTIIDLPFHGDYPSGTPDAVDFNLRPQTAEEAAECTAGTHQDLIVRWVNRRGITDDYNYKIAWTHCITSLEDPSGNFVGQRASWILEGIMTVAPTIPEVVVASPLDTSSDVPTNAKISVAFNELMDPATITGGGLTVNPGNICNGNITTADNLVFECDPGALSANTFYTVTLDTSVTDGNGTALDADVVTSFTTGDSIDSTAPTIVSISPPDGATDISVSNSVTVTFDDASLMGAQTLNAISLSHGATSIPGDVTSTDNLAFVFTPFNDLDYNTVYTVHVDSSSVVDVAGNALASDSTTSFTTGTATTLVDADSGTRITIDNTGASLVKVGTISIAQAGGTPPDRVLFDNEFITYTINGVTDQVIVTIDFPQDLTGKVIYKVIDGTYTLLEEGTDYTLVDNDTITLTLIDNGPMDSDPTVGVIVDPIVAGIDLGPRPVPGTLGSVDVLLLIGLAVWLGLIRSNVLSRLMSRRSGFMAAMVCMLMVTYGCTGVRPFPYQARSGDTVLVAAGSLENMTVDNTSIQYTSVDNPGISFDITDQGGAIESIFKLYPDRASKTWSFPSLLLSLVSDAALHGPWVNMVAVRLPDAGMPVGDGLLRVTTAGTDWNIDGANKQISDTDIPIKILPGDGSNDPAPFEYYSFSGSTRVGNLGDLSPASRITVKPSAQEIRDAPFSATGTGAVEINIVVPLLSVNGNPVPDSDLRVVVDDMPRNIDAQLQMNWSRTGDSINVYMLAPQGMDAMQSSVSVLYDSNNVMIDPNAAAPYVAGITYYDIAGDVTPGPGMQVSVYP